MSSIALQITFSFGYSVSTLFLVADVHTVAVPMPVIVHCRYFLSERAHSVSPNTDKYSLLCVILFRPLVGLYRLSTCFRQLCNTKKLNSQLTKNSPGRRKASIAMYLSPLITIDTHLMVSTKRIYKLSILLFLKENPFILLLDSAECQKKLLNFQVKWQHTGAASTTVDLI